MLAHLEHFVSFWFSRKADLAPVQPADHALCANVHKCTSLVHMCHHTLHKLADLEHTLLRKRIVLQSAQQLLHTYISASQQPAELCLGCYYKAQTS
jgi:hypothetical protein